MADAPRVLTLTGGRNGAPIQVTGDVLSDDHDVERHIANDRHPEIPLAFDWTRDIVSEWRHEVTDSRTATLGEEQDQGVYANTVLQGSTQL